MKVKNNRVSTLNQSGNRFTVDEDKYDLILFDKVSGSIPFKEREKTGELVKLVEYGQVSELTVEDFSRLGRHIRDVVSMLVWL